MVFTEPCRRTVDHGRSSQAEGSDPGRSAAVADRERAPEAGRARPPRRPAQGPRPERQVAVHPAGAELAERQAEQAGPADYPGRRGQVLEGLTESVEQVTAPSHERSTPAATRRALKVPRIATP